MIQNLDFAQLRQLLQTVFSLSPNEKELTFLVDMPNELVPDSQRWQDRRSIAAEWYMLLQQNKGSIPFSSINFCIYDNVGSNNNDLPDTILVIENVAGGIISRDGRVKSLREILSCSSVVIAMTELSATAPLKILAKKLGFRGATLPGFMRDMIPTLALDYEKVNERVLEFKNRMDKAEAIKIRLVSAGREYVSCFDLRYRTGHASGGLMREPGMVGNLPSGEAYIVPYEGERPNEPSRTEGFLPVQFDQEVVVYRIKNNRAVEVTSVGQRSSDEQSKLFQEPAYGNMAEVGIGVLGEWGVMAVGSTLLDEKLGLHIAFGRSDHFGGVTSPAAFRDSKKVIHIDRVYVPSTQPLIHVLEATFEYPGGKRETVIESGKYVV